MCSLCVGVSSCFLFQETGDWGAECVYQAYLLALQVVLLVITNYIGLLHSQGQPILFHISHFPSGACKYTAAYGGHVMFRQSQNRRRTVGLGVSR
jgi:hypothetical protein